MTMGNSDHNDDDDAAQRRADDAVLLAQLTASPPLQHARESYLFWQQRRRTLPVHKRAERKKAERIAARRKERLAQAEREHYGPGLFEQLLNALGVHRVPTLPSRRKIALSLSVVAVLTALLLIALLGTIIVLWPDPKTDRAHPPRRCG
jgi:hypothetical protein